MYSDHVIAGYNMIFVMQVRNYEAAQKFQLPKVKLKIF